MTRRQFDTMPLAAKTELAPARQPARAQEPAPARTIEPGEHQASGARHGPLGAALLQLQRERGNRFVQQVVSHARAEAASASGPAGGQGPASLRQDISAARAGGRPLDGSVGGQLSQAFGSDFGDVVVHTDARADALTRSLQASAFTVGRDVFFSRGAYAPGTRSGRELLAHELTHVVQQAGAPGGGASGPMTVSPANDHHEREADRKAAEITSAGRSRPPAAAGGRPSATGTGTGTGPVRTGASAGAVLQRKYLDQQPPGTGLAAWVKDTTVKKGLTKASRAKLATVDQMLQVILATKGTGNWKQAGEGYLEELDDALKKTKYAQTPSTKSSKAYKKRQRAVKGLRDEIQQTLSTMKLLEIVAGTGHQAAPVQQPANANLQQAANANLQQAANANLQQAANANLQQPQTGRPDQAGMVAELSNVGFLAAYLNSLAPGDLDLLYDAHMALGARDLPQAQALLDLLNPLTPETTASTLGWASEGFKKHTAATLFDFDRAAPKSGNMMAAQRQLLAFHAAKVGGDYATLLSYKPYKKNALSDAEVRTGSDYFDDAQLRLWANTEAGLDAAKDQTSQIAKDATDESNKKNKGKADKPELTYNEVAAIRVYTSDVYQEMNAVFRDFRVDQATANWAKYSAIAKLAISGLGKLPKARGKTSYRGDNDILFGGHAGILKFGGTFRLPNFYSTTQTIGKAFKGALAYIFYNQRQGRVVEKFSVYQDETEILIPPGAAFRITGEYHKVGNTWQSHDGRILGDAPKSPTDDVVEAFVNGDQFQAMRQTILEFTEIGP